MQTFIHGMFMNLTHSYGHSMGMSMGMHAYGAATPVGMAGSTPARGVRVYLCTLRREIRTGGGCT